MAAISNKPRLLLKLASAKSARPARAELKMGSATLGMSLEPLFETRPGTAIGAAADKHRWWVADISMESMGAAAPPVNVWDLCHRVVTSSTRIMGSRVEFAEPDIEQFWPVEENSPDGLGFAAGGDPDRDPDPQDSRYNKFTIDDAFRNDKHSGLDSARAAIGNIPDEERVRIAHFDTGYDEDHATLPHHIDTHLERNFVDPGFPNDARDRTRGLLTNLGHGTGTLGILAGKSWGTSGVAGRDLGGAPFARVVPIRVANSVVLFKTSAIAKAFDYVVNLSADPATRVDVVTMSMGGLASRAWAEAVNRAYDAGIFIVTAAGNNKNNLPTRYIVYPARFNRVIAACGVQARISPNRLDPYADLGWRRMAGNYGPDSKVEEAMAGFTPNIPWPRIHSGDKVDFNGGGTSSATPQIAAAAAIWIQKNRSRLAAYQHGWQRVEAIRHALFSSAGSWSGHETTVRKYFGRGLLRANDALSVSPPAARYLKKAGRDNTRFALARLMGGLSIAGARQSGIKDMMGLEILQLAQSSESFADALDDIGAIKGKSRQSAQLKATVMAQRGISGALRAWALGDTSERSVAPVQPPKNSGYYEKLRIDAAKNPPVAIPAFRRLRVFSSDPSAAVDTGLRRYAESTVKLPWRDVAPGPVDEYLEIVDIDPDSRTAYAPIDLNASHVLASDGLSPSESDPRFHQQMVYAVASKTIRHFEEALGRPALWSTRQVRLGGKFHDQFVRRLRIYPHALRESNAYYSPDKKALLFGYFMEAANLENGIAPGSTVFTCLSYDIVAHETAHALLDGLHRRYSEITSGDARAFHEAFADLVALFQHFTHKNILAASIAKSGSDWEKFGPEITELATQFGRAIGYRGALRSAIGLNADNKKDTIQSVGDESHDKGAVLVAAMFDAYTNIYHRRSADLIRIASQGTGILADGALHPDLVNRLAREAAKAASHMLRMTIRALDYCPPVAITLGDYLRALITSDIDLYPDDDYGYRTALVSAFRDRGIHPAGVSSITADSLAWDRPEIDGTLASELAKIFQNIDANIEFRNWKLTTERKTAHRISEAAAEYLAGQLRKVLESRPYGEEEAGRLGFTLKTKSDGRVLGKRRKIENFEIHSVRPARRIDVTRQERLDLVVEITQRLEVPGAGGSYRGGATWIVDADTGLLRYIVHKRITNTPRIESEHQFRMAQRANPVNNYYRNTSTPSEPFAMVHRSNGGEAL